MFVGHEASCTGAPIALLHFMRWFKVNIGWPFSCLLLKGGDLEDAFHELCPTSVLHPDDGYSRSTSTRILNRLGFRDRARRLHEAACMANQIPNPSLIYLNSLAGVDALEVAATTGAPVLSHVHELEFIMRAGIGPERSQKALDLSKRFIACSQAVARNLERHDIAPDRIDVVYEFIETGKSAQYGRAESRTWLRKHLGLPDNAVLVAGSGTLGWRKGSDIFLQVARLVRELEPELPIHFFWLGGKEGTWATLEFVHDLELCELGGLVTHILNQTDPLRYFAGADMFALTSREDPYPLVCLEAASCGMPVLCFDRAGGMPEFVEQDAGRIVPALNASAMADTIIELARNKQLCEALGDAASVKVRERHDISTAGPQLFYAISQTVRDGRVDTYTVS